MLFGIIRYYGHIKPRTNLVFGLFDPTGYRLLNNLLHSVSVNSACTFLTLFNASDFVMRLRAVITIYVGYESTRC